MEPPVGNKFRIGRKICGRFFGEIYLVIIKRGSCGCKREEKGGGGTSGQGHSSEAETHDQESAASYRERKQDLGNSGGGKSSCNLISNSYKVMHEVQQPGTRKTPQDRSDFFSSTNASALYKPFAASSTGMKRLSPYGNSAVDAYPKKMRAVINKGEYERSKVVPTAQKEAWWVKWQVRTIATEGIISSYKC
ncbi:uncharacterized protein LOC130933173 [Arachis stenosperma]|uniref:uncharacterized protein LOC130933173 n=1 Tax=Arachis stenosperma TaxID=217475 RepID=UPI0025AC6704|nr:uncharacterized protein LOC130933173 [Arachis stenosperma]